MPSDVFETVVDILDPELNIGSEANFDDDALLAKQRRKGESMTAEHGDQSMADLTTEQPTPTQITQVYHQTSKIRPKLFIYTFVLVFFASTPRRCQNNFFQYSNM